MATRKNTCKNPVPTSPAEAHIAPQPSSLGDGLLKQFKRALAAHLILEDYCQPSRAADAYDSAQRFARTLALVPPRGAAEALAAVIFLFDEASDIDQANGWTEDRCKEWSLRMQQRASALADWIETTHKIDRKDWHLDHFCSGDTRNTLLPHTAPVIDVNAPPVGSAERAMV